MKTSMTLGMKSIYGEVVSVKREFSHGEDHIIEIRLKKNDPRLASWVKKEVQIIPRSIVMPRAKDLVV